MPSPHRLQLTIGLFAVFICTMIVFAWMVVRIFSVTEWSQTRYGVTFSTRYALQLGLDPMETYRGLVEDLGIRAVRLPVYWSDVERSSGVYDWWLLDQLVEYSAQMGVELTMVVGVKVPRWPECYVPDWAEGLDAQKRQQTVLRMIETTVNRYKKAQAVVRWQVENEPFFPYGECPHLTREEFRERVDLVRRLDPARPIQITVSGELGSWKTEADAADVLGISLYRLTWNDLFGYFVYPLSPAYYYSRAQFVSQDVDRVIVSELQAEPWFPEPIERRELLIWYQLFDADMLRANFEFVEQTHLPEVYLWGAEWWYLLKKNNNDRLWQTAKEYITPKNL